jgi:hypothetical protein
MPTSLSFPGMRLWWKGELQRMIEKSRQDKSGAPARATTGRTYAYSGKWGDPNAFDAVSAIQTASAPLNPLINAGLALTVKTLQRAIIRKATRSSPA